MPRNAANAKWYLPLFAGTELTARSGPLTQYDADDLIGTLPPPLPWMLPGLSLWLDAAASGSLHTLTSGRLYQWDDLSGNNKHATQPLAEFQPRVQTNVLLPRTVTFQD